MKKVGLLVSGFLIVAGLVLYMCLYRKADTNLKLYTAQTLMYQKIRLRQKTLLAPHLFSTGTEAGTGVGTHLTMTNPNVVSCKIDLQPVDITSISDKVTNCTTKNKEGKIPSQNNETDTEREYTYILHQGDVGIALGKDDVKADVLCKQIMGTGKDDIYYRKLRSQGKEQSFGIIPLFILDPIKAVSSRGWLSFLNSSSQGDVDYCAEGNYSEYAGATLPDADCVEMKESRSTSGRKYYFVAGYRDDMPGKLLYVINGRVYDPGESYLSNIGNTTGTVSGRWQFTKVLGNRALVKKIIDMKIIPDKKDDKGNQLTSYVLQSCDLPLR